MLSCLWLPTLCVSLGLVSSASCSRGEAELRIYNEGRIALQQLTVLFPDDQVSIGDVRPQSASAYVHVQHGVGDYAAFRFTVDGVPVDQIVADFVGWKPVAGKRFTYRVQLEPRTSGPFLRLLEVVREK